MTRVLVLARWYPTRAEPTRDVFVREHARAAALEHEVGVLHWDPVLEPSCATGSRPVPLEDPRETGGLRTWRIRQRVTRLPLSMLAQGAWALRRALPNLWPDGRPPDLIHAHVFQAGALAALATLGLRLPWVVTEHYSAVALGRLGRRDRLQARLAYQGAGMVLPVSAALRAGVERCAPGARCRVVPNPVDLERFRYVPRPPNEPRRLLFVGRLAEIKDLPLLLRGLARLRQRRDDWRLELVGDGPERARVEGLVAELALGGLVRVRGALPHAEVGAELARADLLVLTSQWENLPCVIAEAHVAGVPVVAREVGGVGEMLTPATGVLFRERDPGALADALDAALDAPFERGEIAAQAAARYSLAAVGRALGEVYAEVLARQPG